ncbi:Ryanodine receptor 44F [Orchesella cincta]|uniref:Ryanodine receptor 44F n=1 Tax=Orchesella cincta TaxID=48709 RepID=A0A1D2MKU4_ORCCI|nr:Ryanodine receptor 44F [Orchesella cincta]
MAVDRSSCYMVRADELFNQVTPDSGGKGASQGMFIGCTVDTATGYINFYCEGKPTKYIYKMEPGTKLFPAVFVEATSKEMLQFELGRTSTTLPLSSAVLLNSGKHLQPQFPPRLKVQYLRPHQWARVPNINLKVHALKLSELRGWSTLCEDSVSMLALHIPEEDRCIDILELIEMDKLLSFHYHTLTLYAALCYQSNFRAAHTLCTYVDQKQLLFAIQADYLSGPLRRGFYDLLIALHMESFATTMEVCKNEFIIPVIPELKELYEDDAMRHSLRSVTTISIRPEMTMTDIDGSVEDLKDLSSPYFPLEIVRDFTMTSISEAVRLNQVHIRDPIGGSNENLFVPLLKLIDKLLMVGIINDEDLDRLLVMIDPQTWDPEKEKSDVFKFQRFPSETEDEEDHRKGLLFMELAEGVKLQLCYLLHHLNDIQLRHRVESIVAFSHDYVGEVQADQLKRYVEIKQSDLPSAIAAKKTREFRCPPIEQTKCILGFKLWEEIDDDNRPCAQELIDQLREYHDGFVEKLSLEAIQDAEQESDESGSGGKLSMITKVIDMLNIVKKLEPPVPPVEVEPPRELTPEEKFRKVLTKTIVRWAEETQFETPLLVKEMFG